MIFLSARPSRSRVDEALEPAIRMIRSLVLFRAETYGLKDKAVKTMSNEYYGTPLILNIRQKTT